MNELASLEIKERGLTLANAFKQITPHLSSRGFPLCTHYNLKVLLDMLNVSLRYNVMKKETEISIPDVTFSTDNQYNVSSTWIYSAMKQVEMPTEKYMEMLELLADSHQFNPVESWLTNTPWDGVSRLQEFYDTITLTYESDRPAVEAFISKWMLGAVESICNPKGADMSGILVLQGPQEIGKTWWVRKLVPKDAPETISGAVRVGVQIDPSNKDSIEQCVAHWIVEFGELDGIFRKADVASLKNFLTRPMDTFRKSFARRKSEYPRRTAFIASVNDWSYLVDETGNRRFWTVACKKINSYHEIDMQQLWAEMYHKRINEKMPYTLNDAEKALLNEINERHQAIEPIAELLAVKYDWEVAAALNNWRYITATEIAIELGYQRPDMRDVRKVATFARKLNGGLSKRGKGKDMLAIPQKKPDWQNE